MMPYTCIVRNTQGKIETKLVYGEFGAPVSASNIIQEENPGMQCIAAIPGNHMNSAWTVDDYDQNNRRSSSMDIDLWDTRSY